ncbi:MAG: 5-methyltetrahydropteroyltriglutamate--homocysteine S-methyltransferase [Aquificae bacterium]|nr:5-methyltetrahydropteroyltriglutamate--homocysteine S-methyltransferase [Aquificota bacterium]
MRVHAFGFPKLGEKREFKKLLEGYWRGSLTEEELLKGIDELKLKRAQLYAQYADFVPSNELSLYDFMLDMAVTLGAVPERFMPYEGLKTYFEMARGKGALELTKWFNTNYHYLVPELETTAFKLLDNKPLKDYLFHREHGYETVPHLIGPYTFLRLSKAPVRKEEGGLPVVYLEKLERTELLERFAEALLPAYRELLRSLKEAGVRRVHLEEPALVLDVPAGHWEVVRTLYEGLSEEGLELVLFTYYDAVDDYERFVELPVSGFHFDLVYGKESLKNLKQKGFPKGKELVLGLVNGRQPWRANLKEKLKLLEELAPLAERVTVSTATPLYHLPVTVEPESSLPEGLKERLAFAKEKLQELALLKRAFLGEEEALGKAAESERVMTAVFARNDAVRRRLASLKEEDFRRELPYEERDKLQRERLKLPLFPTTTIGSFPQTEDVRKMRVAYRKGKVSKEEYERFIREKIKYAIELQEEIGLDVLVHGEFERSDMVEFFAQKLEGIATTEHGWVLSYGSRVYRPPIIYGDVSRPGPMTLNEITYAQSLTDKPVKGMLTGPVTILNWSYYPEDRPKEEVAYQIALALQDEVRELEEAGIKVIQIDEPAFREGAPLKRKDWEEYFRWAVRAFRLASRAKPETQIHTHMCYSEFNEILNYIYEMDFDVISIEASRSKGEIIEAFERFGRWDRQIGIGVYDIHSPAVPSKEEMKAVVRRAMRVLPKELLWVNPDCGLKTRRWEEVIPALKNMVQAAKELREEAG